MKNYSYLFGQIPYAFYQPRFRKYINNEFPSNTISKKSVNGNFGNDLSIVKHDLKKLKKITKDLHPSDISDGLLIGYIHEYLLYKRHLGNIQPTRVNIQHWLPECYLKNFADKVDETETYRLSKLDMKDLTVSLVSLSEFATAKKESNIYTDSTEKFFSLVEHDFAEVFRSIESNDSPTVWEKIILSVFFAGLSLRSKFIIKQLNFTDKDFFDNVFAFSHYFAIKEIVHFQTTSDSPVRFSHIPIQLLSWDNISDLGFYAPLSTHHILLFVPKVKNKEITFETAAGSVEQGIYKTLDRAIEHEEAKFIYVNPEKSLMGAINDNYENISDDLKSQILVPVKTWYKEYPKLFRASKISQSDI